jgi:hypothetical protein
VRTDTVSGGTETRLYDLGTTYTLCYNSGGGWRCTQSSAGARTQTDVINASAFADTARFDVAAAGTRSVAGVTAQCFNVTDKLAAATSVYCVSGEGVPLYIETTANSTTVTMTATNYATSVNDSDFVPPEEAAPQNGTPAVTPGGANVP